MVYRSWGGGITAVPILLRLGTQHLNLVPSSERWPRIQQHRMLNLARQLRNGAMEMLPVLPRASCHAPQAALPRFSLNLLSLKGRMARPKSVPPA